MYLTLTEAGETDSTCQMLKGVIFDLDGTVVDSRLDFVAIRRDLGLAENAPILEAIDRNPNLAERVRMHEILDRHELAGAERASLMPGIAELLSELETRKLRTAVFTRNSRKAAARTLERLNLRFEVLIAREDAPPKPDPAGLAVICERWRTQPDHIVFIGDYLYDLQAGRRAGIPTVLYAPEAPDFRHDAEWILPHFDGFWPLCREIFGF